MITIDKLNMVFAGISIIVTGMSIIYSCKASKSAKLARQYKEETLHLREVLDLENLSSKFFLLRVNTFWIKLEVTIGIEALM